MRVLGCRRLDAPGGCQRAQKMEKVVASWLPIMQTMAYYVALEEKLFEKAGIEIDSKMFQSPNQIIDSLVAGQADFGPPGAAAGITVLAEVALSRHLQGVRAPGRRHQGEPHQRRADRQERFGTSRRSRT